MLPSIFGERLFDDWMDFSFGALDDVGRKLYGKNASHVMKTDVKEKEGNYEVDIDLPGFKKDQITVQLDQGYLTIKAEKGLDKDKKDKSGKMIRQERYSGTMQRSYYVGEDISQDEIKAKFEDGVLKLTVPKREQKQVAADNTIKIEG